MNTTYRKPVDFVDMNTTDRCTIGLALLDRIARLQENLRQEKDDTIAVRWITDELEMAQELRERLEAARDAEQDGN